MPHPIGASAFDHLVLRCGDVEASLAFYTDVLGLAPVRVIEWRAGWAPFPSIRVSADSIIDLIPADGPTDAPNVDHFCLVTSADALRAITAEPERYRVTAGPVRRYGARGTGHSVYLLDPDGNTVELRTYERLRSSLPEVAEPAPRPARARPRRRQPDGPKRSTRMRSAGTPAASSSPPAASAKPLDPHT